MAWIRRNNPHYRMFLTDGYVSPSDIAAASDKDVAASPEQRMVQDLHRMSTTPPKGRHKKIRTDYPLHFWVIGNSGWLKQSSAQTGLLRGIHEDDKGDDYRIYITGSAWPDGCYGGDIMACLRRAGMKRKKKHANRRDFQECGMLLLDLMFDHYSQEQRTPSIVLDRLDIPYAFCGHEEGENKDLTLNDIRGFQHPQQDISKGVLRRRLRELDRRGVPYVIQPDKNLSSCPSA
jgi:hypothetical protein